MKNLSKLSLLGATLAFMGFTFGTSAITVPALAGTFDEVHDGVFITEAWRIREGGRIYANWADELGGDLPETTHPAYPAIGKKKGATTWRCKECHGWDYKGKDGAYGSGGHYTGIKGVDGFTGKGPRVLATVLRDSNHQYTDKMIPNAAIENLSYFLSLGQIDMDAYISRETKKARGNLRHGAEVFQTVCAVCHGLNGQEINFHSPDNPEYIGNVARENPWELLHNIRFGHSGDAMVGLIAFSTATQVDVLAYAQTLPIK